MERVEERHTPHNSQPCIKFICFMQNALLGAETGVVDSKRHITTNVILLDSDAVYNTELHLPYSNLSLYFNFQTSAFTCLLVMQVLRPADRPGVKSRPGRA